MKLFVVFGFLCLGAALAMPAGETETETEVKELDTTALTEETDALTLERSERSYGKSDTAGGLASFVYGGHSAGTYIGRNEPCSKRSYKPEHKGHGGHGYGHEHKGHGGYEHKGHGGHGYGHEHKGHGGHGYGHEAHHGGHGYGHEHKKHEGHGYGHGHGHSGHGGHGYGHEHKGHGGHGYEHKGHGGHGYGHEHKSHGHGYGHGHGGHGHGYKSNFEAAEQFEQFDSQADFVASSHYGHAAPAYGHHQAHHVQPTHHQTHSYGAHAPKVECGSNLLVGCQVHTAKVPCVPSHGHGYGHAAPAYHHAPAPAKYDHKPAAHGYKFGADEDKETPKEGEHRSEPNSLHVDPSTNVSNGQSPNNNQPQQQHPGAPASDATSKRDETIAAMKKIMEKVNNKEQSS